MFDEILFKFNIGCKIVAGQLIVGQFGPKPTSSLVAISQTMDKLIIRDLKSNIFNSDQIDYDDASFSMQQNSPSNYFCVTVKDMIHSISTKSIELASTTDATRQAIIGTKSAGNDGGEAILDSKQLKVAQEGNQNKAAQKIDLLLIGCAGSVLIFDVYNQISLCNITMPTRISSITTINSINSKAIGYLYREMITKDSFDEVSICAGPQKIYSLIYKSKSLTCDLTTTTDIAVEISSERSTSEQITSMIQGSLDTIKFVITGSIEQRIRLYLIDTFEQNISTCELTIEENSHVNCLCSIDTISTGHIGNFPTSAGMTNPEQREFGASVKNHALPSIMDDKISIQAVEENVSNKLLTDYFAYGLESGLIGVHRLFSRNSKSNEIKNDRIIFHERLWRHKTKYVPLTMIMFDINGDGLDELLIGYESSRLEARLPFTGQLIASTKCFKSDRLAGLSVFEEPQRGLILLACSTNGSVVGYKPRFCKPRIPLLGYAERAKLSDNDPLNHGLAVQDPYLESAYSTNRDIMLEADQSRNLFDENRATAMNLHIETQGDDTKPTKCDAKQNLDLLQKINSLYCEQLELERKTCHIYHENINQTSKLDSSDLEIKYLWDFDEKSIGLGLTILVESYNKSIELIKLEDESRNILENRFIFAKPEEFQSLKEKSKFMSSHFVRIPIRCSKNLATILKLQIFFLSQTNEPLNQSRLAPPKLSRVYTTTIKVPKYSMFVLKQYKLPCEVTRKDDIRESNVSNESIEIIYDRLSSKKMAEVVEWLEENFLCIRSLNSGNENKTSEVESMNLENQEEIFSLSSLGSDLNKVLSQSRSRSSEGSVEFYLELIDLTCSSKKMANPEKVNPNEAAATSSKELKLDVPNYDDDTGQQETLGCKFSKLGSTLRIAAQSGRLSLKSENSDLLVDLVQSLMIDRLYLEPSSDKLQRGEVTAHVKPLLDELDAVTKNSRQMKESETKIQTELYESTDYAKNLMQQFAISNELNEFSTSKELLGEMSMMLNGVQNAVQVLSLNKKSRTELSDQLNELKEKVSLLKGLPTL